MVNDITEKTQNLINTSRIYLILGKCKFLKNDKYCEI